MQENKNLIIRTMAQNYKNENDFEELVIFLPLKYNEHDLGSCTIQLNILNQDVLGDVITLQNPEIEKNKYKYVLPIKQEWTYKPGIIQLWLSFLLADKTVGYTNEVHFVVNETKEITDYIPEQSLSLLGEWTLKMHSMESEIKDMIQHFPVIGENGNWYVYVNGKYIDSGAKVEIGFKTHIKDDYWIMFGTEG